MKTCADCSQPHGRAAPQARLCVSCAKKRKVDGNRTRRAQAPKTKPCADCSAAMPRSRHSPRCEGCVRVYMKVQRKERYWQAPEDARAATKSWARANPDKVRVAEQAKRPRRKAKRASDPTYRARLNAKRMQAYHRSAACPEYRAANSRRACLWVKENPQKKAVQSARRRARKMAALGAFTAAEWAERLRLFGGFCAYCDQPAESIDHVIPLVEGGSNDILNLVPACRSCNSSKGDRMPLEWAGVA